MKARLAAALFTILAKAGGTRPGRGIKRGGGADVGSLNIHSPREFRSVNCYRGARQGARHAGNSAGISSRVTSAVANRGQFEMYLLVQRGGAIDRLRKTLIIAEREGSAGPRREVTGEARQWDSAVVSRAHPSPPASH